MIIHKDRASLRFTSRSQSKHKDRAPPECVLYVLLVSSFLHLLKVRASIISFPSPSKKVQRKNPAAQRTNRDSVALRIHELRNCGTCPSFGFQARSAHTVLLLRAIKYHPVEPSARAHSLKNRSVRPRAEQIF